MKVDAIREYCLDFPEAKENLQWGDELCFKVGGKIFVMLGLDNPRLCFKCTPEAFDELQLLIRTSYEMVAAKAIGKKVRKKTKSLAKRKHPRR